MVILQIKEEIALCYKSNLMASRGNQPCSTIRIYDGADPSVNAHVHFAPPSTPPSTPRPVTKFFHNSLQELFKNSS